MIRSIAAIAIGAALGALLRWQLGTRLNPRFPLLPPGTLTANLLGGLLIGVALSTFVARPDLAGEWRLFVVTGFLGGLTTFSTFSAEVAGHLLERRRGWAFGLAAAHVGGSLSMTAAGFAAASFVLRGA